MFAVIVTKQLYSYSSSLLTVGPGGGRCVVTVGSIVEKLRRNTLRRFPISPPVIQATGKRQSGVRMKPRAECSQRGRMPAASVRFTE